MQGLGSGSQTTSMLMWTSPETWRCKGREGGKERMRLRRALEHSALADGARLSAELERIYGSFERKASVAADLGLHHGSECLLEVAHQIGCITQWATLNLLTPAASVGT